MRSKSETDQILEFVKQEPRVVSDIAARINKSWVTAERYVEQIASQTGLIKTKKFRSGTKGAIKIVYWNYSENLVSDEVRSRLFEKIKLGTTKTDFDPLEAFQFVAPTSRRVWLEVFEPGSVADKQSLLDFFDRVQDELFVFSGNLSFLRYPETKQAFSDLLSRGVRVKCICRVDIGTLDNFKKIEALLVQFGNQVEIRHCRQPLRGFIADSKVVRLKDEKKSTDFKETELSRNVRILYEFFDPTWLNWFQSVFWYLFRTGSPYSERLDALQSVQFK